VVLSDRIWRRRFQADPGVLGRAVDLNGRPFTVIGVAPTSFKGSIFAVEMDFWAPITMRAQLGDDPGWWKLRDVADLLLLGRLNPGVNRRQAEAQLNALAERLAQQNPRSHEPAKFNVVSEVDARHQDFLGRIRLVAALALGMSGLVWLVACANVANLLLARATVRSREMAIRLSLGAARWRVARQLLTKSMLLAALGGGLAVVLTFWAAAALSTGGPPTVQPPIVLDFSPDLRVLSWGVAISLLTGLVFGLAPIRQAARTNLVPGLKPGDSGSGRGARRLSLRTLLVIAQLSVSVVVLVSGGLFVRSLHNARAGDLGFQTERLLSVRLDPGLVGHSGERTIAF